MNTYWKNKHVDLGRVKGGKKVQIDFIGTEDLPKIKNIKPSCGCVNYNYLENDKRLIITYRVDNKPKHMTDMFYYNINKTVSIEYYNGEKDVLSFSIKSF